MSQVYEPTYPTDEEIKQHEVQFMEFAEHLFRPIVPPVKNSIRVELDIENDADVQHFLYALFGYGFRKKQGTDDAPSDPMKFFEFIREYFHAIGFNVILDDYQMDDAGGVADIKIHFEALPL